MVQKHPLQGETQLQNYRESYIPFKNLGNLKLVPNLIKLPLLKY